MRTLLLALSAVLSATGTPSRRPGRAPRRAVLSCAASACASFAVSRKAATAGIWTGPEELTSNLLRPGAPRFNADTSLYTETFVATFAEPALGLDLEAADGGRIVVKSAKPGSPGFLAGIPAGGYLTLVSVNGQSTSGLSLKEVGKMVQSAQRPVTLSFDGTATADAMSEELQRKRVAEYRDRIVLQGKKVPWIADSMDLYDRYDGDLSKPIAF